MRKFREMEITPFYHTKNLLNQSQPFTAYRHNEVVTKLF